MMDKRLLLALLLFTPSIAMDDCEEPTDDIQIVVKSQISGEILPGITIYGGDHMEIITQTDASGQAFLPAELSNGVITIAQPMNYYSAVHSKEIHTYQGLKAGDTLEVTQYIQQEDNYSAIDTVFVDPVERLETDQLALTRITPNRITSQFSENSEPQSIAALVYEPQAPSILVASRGPDVNGRNIPSAFSYHLGDTDALRIDIPVDQENAIEFLGTPSDTSEIWTTMALRFENDLEIAFSDIGRAPSDPMSRILRTPDTTSGADAFRFSTLVFSADGAAYQYQLLEMEERGDITFDLKPIPLQSVTWQDQSQMELVAQASIAYDMGSEPATAAAVSSIASYHDEERALFGYLIWHVYDVDVENDGDEVLTFPRLPSDQTQLPGFDADALNWSQVTSRIYYGGDNDWLTRSAPLPPKLTMSSTSEQFREDGNAKALSLAKQPEYLRKAMLPMMR